MKYLVYEVQDESRWRMWFYRVEAASAEEALESVNDGQENPEAYGEYGESEFGDSGFYVVPDTEEHKQDNWKKAADNMVGKDCPGDNDD